MPERTPAVIAIGSTISRVSVFRVNGGGHSATVADVRAGLQLLRGLSAKGRADAAEKRKPDWRSYRPPLSKGDEWPLEKTGLRLALADELEQRPPPDPRVPAAMHDVQRAHIGVDLPAPSSGSLATLAARSSHALGCELRFMGRG
ncbi:MAG: hypothetical protein FJZ97_12405 [Chloroflexi bacterium]|nr:hypothetical protein [Chloroflexota bacterium]